MSEQSQQSKPDRKWVCESCNSTVRARWFGPGSFAVGCECTTVPVVPQMGQDETPRCWRVQRPECCRDVDANSLETIYGERGKDYQCPDCKAKYTYDGKMVEAPNKGR